MCNQFEANLAGSVTVIIVKIFEIPLRELHEDSSLLRLPFFAIVHSKHWEEGGKNFVTYNLKDLGPSSISLTNLWNSCWLALYTFFAVSKVVKRILQKQQLYQLKNPKHMNIKRNNRQPRECRRVMNILLNKSILQLKEWERGLCYKSMFWHACVCAPTAKACACVWTREHACVCVHNI